MLRWLRAQANTLPPVDQAIVIVAFVLISLRIILPIWHTDNGYLLYWYPFEESEVCVQEKAKCNIDRSRTAVESGSIALFVAGILLMRRGRK
jgi:hypothetical protein